MWLVLVQTLPDTCPRIAWIPPPLQLLQGPTLSWSCVKAVWQTLLAVYPSPLPTFHAGGSKILIFPLPSSLAAREGHVFLFWIMRCTGKLLGKIFFSDKKREVYMGSSFC